MERFRLQRCDKCDGTRPHRTVEGVDYCNDCDTRHPDPFVFGELSDLEKGRCYLRHREFLRGVLTEFPNLAARRG